MARFLLLTHLPPAVDGGSKVILRWEYLRSQGHEIMISPPTPLLPTTLQKV